MRNKHLFISTLMLMLPMTIWGQASSPTTLYIDQGAITIGSTSISGYDKDGNQVTATNANGYIITQTDASTATSNTITVNDKYSGTITLNNVNITTSQEKAVPFNADKAGQVTLRLGGENKLIVNYTGESNETPGLATPWGNGCGIIIEDDPNINETGTLETKGCTKSPGIGLIYQGVSDFAPGSYITINSGIITATGGNGNEYGWYGGAGIGTCWGNPEAKYGGTITINGGIVTATGGSGASGIGGGSKMNGGTTIINGGTVIATGGNSSIGNGNGNSKTNSFTTGTSAHAFIIANKGISDQTKQQDWNGVIFLTKETGKIYGKNIGITTSATIPNGYTLTIGQGETLAIDGCTLTVANGGTLTNNGGTIITLNGGKIEDYSGTVASSGYKITCHANNGISPEETKVQYTTGQTATIANPFSAPQYQKFKGWYANAADETGGPVTTVSSSTDLYAHWEPNTFTLNTLTVPTLTYGTAMQDITLSSLLPVDAVTNCGTITFSVSGDLPTGLKYENDVISGTPKTVNTTGTTVTIKATAANTSTATLTPTFTVGKAIPTLSDITLPTTENLVYDSNKKEASATVTGISGETAQLAATLTYYVGENNTTALTTSANSGAEGDGKAPVNVGTYTVKASFAGNGNYNAVTDKTATFTIAPAEPALAFGQTNGYEITYGESAASIQASSTDSKGNITYAYYTNKECTTGQTSTQPTDAGSYWVKATIAANGNYAEKSITTTYVIKQKDLTVTPTANQILFNGGKNANIAYTTDASGVELTGSLAFEQNGSGHVITIGTLAIKNDADKKNYNLALSSTSVAITVYEEEAKDVEATATSGLNGNGWANSSLTLSAPTGFVFTNAEGTDSESGSKTFTAEGCYYLKQTTGATVYPHLLPIDKTNPAIPATPDDGSVTTTTATFTLEDALSGIASYKVTENNQEIAAYPEVRATTTGEKSQVYTYTGTAGTTHTLTFEVTDRADNTATSSVTFTLKSNPVVPPGVTSYYDIYLEPNDSVRLSVGKTTVEEGYSFTLTAEVAEGYDPATLVVEYRKGRSGSWQTLEAESSGKYRIRSVYSDIYIRASVRPLDDPTALETVGDGKSHIRTGGGIVYIETPVPQRVTVFTLDGRLIRHESLPAGDSRLYGLPAGLYVIRLQDGTTVKGLVRR